jgi:N4-gp56 family major capsid protein
MANVNTSTSLTQEVMTYYEKVFLDRAKYEFVLKEGAQTRTHSENSGRTINFTRVVPMSVSTTPLAEASNPSACQLTASTVAVTLSEYGGGTITSKLLSLVSIDAGLKETVEVVGQNMGETLNRIVRDELANVTSYIPNGHTTGNIAAGDTLSASAIRQMVQTLEINKAMPYSDGMFIGKTNPQSKYNLLGDTVWVNAHTYKDGRQLYQGEMGELYQVRWLLNKDVASANGDASTAACTVVAYYTYVHGQNAIGTVDLAGDPAKLYIYSGVDSQNTAGRATYVTWAGTYAAKLLNSTWSVVGKFTGA